MIRAQFIGMVILTLLAVFVALPIRSQSRIRLGIDLAGGAELRYSVLFPPGFKGDKEQSTRQATDVIRRRLETLQLREAKINSQGDHGILIQLPGVDAEGLLEVKRLLQALGNLELHEAAPQDLQDRFDKDGVVPFGFKIVKDGDGAALLIQARPVIDGRHIIDAQPQREEEFIGGRWATSFELDAEGARRFDEAAGRLYARQPRGRIVLLLDGRVKSAPLVQSPAFHGRGLISGAKDEKEARELAIILRSGSLPAPIGSTRAGPSENAPQEKR